MEKCPKSKDNYLSYDPHRKTACCVSHDCDFEEKVLDQEDYFRKFVISSLNWENYCARTPLFVRKIRGTLEPVGDGQAL